MSSLSPFTVDHEGPGATPFATVPGASAQTDWELEDWWPGELDQEEADFIAELEEAAAHPLLAAYGLPPAILDALERGQWPVVVELAAGAGQGDQNTLTNIVFYHRHPDMIGRKIGAGQRDLAAEWVSIRDRIVAPALRSAAAPAPAPPAGATGASPAALSSSRLEWPGASDAELAFMRAVYDRHAELSRARGESFVMDLPREALDTIEDGHRARAEAARAARDLLAAARAALAADGLAGKVRIGIVSAYRPATLQFTIWQGKNRRGGFPHYYREAIERGVVRADDFGPGAVDRVARYLGDYIASPGYSNHQDGLAIDFGTGVVGKSLGTIGAKAWFHRWLKANAGRFGFQPYEKETWHWTYRPAAGGAEVFAGEVAAGGVPAGRLELDSVPLLSRHRGKPPDMVLRWNDMTSPPEEIDVVVHLHGYARGGMTLPRGIEPFAGLDLAPVDGAEGQGRARPTLTVLPRGHDTGVKNKSGLYRYTFPQLVGKDDLPRLIAFALERFAAAVGGAAPRVARLILTAHSGGGAPLLAILRHHDPHEVHVYDALYQDAGALAAWARGRLRGDRAAVDGGGGPAGALRVFYGRYTRSHSRAVQRALADDLREAPSELRDRYRVESSTLGHWQIPRQYGWRMLADPGADVPNARVEDTSQRELDEDPEGGEVEVEVELEFETEAGEAPRGLGPRAALPFVLAGPIVRRATRDGVWFWLASRERVRSITPRITYYRPGTAEVDPGLKASKGFVALEQLGSSGMREARLGSKLWVYLVEARPRKGARFPADRVFGYDLSIRPASGQQAISTHDLDLGYPPFKRPTFVLDESHRRLVHGSCRRPGAHGKDAFLNLDQWLGRADVLTHVHARPSALFLTGDQIYADDVEIPFFEAVAELAKDVCGYVERLPFPGGTQSVADYVAKDWGTAKPDPKSRKALTGRPAGKPDKLSSIGFTTEDGEAHLLSFPEFAAMYLLVWNGDLCESYDIGGPVASEQPNLRGFAGAARAARRVLANVATYMVFDDHEITDDWNLDEDFEAQTKNSPTARRILANGLAAFWAFQGWGNAPQQFKPDFVKTVTDHLARTRAAGGEAPAGAAGQRFDGELLSRHWSYVAPTMPRAICVDIRTLRETEKGPSREIDAKPGSTHTGRVLSGPKVQERLRGLPDWRELKELGGKGPPPVVVLPTPLLVHRSIPTARGFKRLDWPEDRYEGDFELYDDSRPQRADLIEFLHDELGLSALIVFSGDVHYGSLINGLFVNGWSKDQIHAGRRAWAMRVVQVTSSPIKNVKKEAFVDPMLRSALSDKQETLVKLALGSGALDALPPAGKIGDVITLQTENHYTRRPDAKGAIGLRADTTWFPQDGPISYVFENHFSIVDLPAAPGGDAGVYFLRSRWSDGSTAWSWASASTRSDIEFKLPDPEPLDLLKQAIPPNIRNLVKGLSFGVTKAAEGYRIARKLGFPLLLEGEVQRGGLSPFREDHEASGAYEGELEPGEMSTHATEEALDAAEHLFEGEIVPELEYEEFEPEQELESEDGGFFDPIRRVYERVALRADIRAGQRDERELTNKIFARRHPDRADTPVDEQDPEWREIRARLVLPELLTGPFIGPIHSAPGTPVGPELRKGVPAGAELSPLSITLRGLRKAPHEQPGPIAAIVLHNTSRGPANRAEKAGYSKPAVHYALNYYIGGDGGFPHYVVDFNGTIYATCDERRMAHHAGWVHKGGAKLFVTDWVKPEWWSRVWSKQGIKTPLNLLPKGARSPNARTIGIELMILPDLSYTEDQYRALARLVIDIQRRNPELRIGSAPSKALLGHEDFAPVTAEGGRADRKGGWDPGAHREDPYFDWQRLWSAIQAVSPGFGGTSEPPPVPSLELAEELDAVHRFEFDDSTERLEPDSALLSEAPGFWGGLVEQALLAAHIGAGNVDPNALTNTIFFHRHPELRGTRLQAGQEALMEEWRQIQRTLVQPALDRARGGTPSSGAAHPSTPSVPLGTLTHTAPGWDAFSYRFTPYDLEWTARFLHGEAGGRDDAENRAVLWAMFNRYAFFRNEIPSWGSFGDFIRQYSTPLQPYLRSVGAARRHWRKCNPQYTNCDYVPMAERYGYYPETTIPRGQLRRFLELQERPWSELSQSSRDLAQRALQGAIPNPIGPASEFADTAVYFRDKHDKTPTREEWLEFTKAFAASKKWLWPSDDTPYDQYKRNVIFVNGRARNLRDGARVTPPEAASE
jgi:N-acetylmuramoyl-L-alanine amidase/D-alanyl-D-alanine carboxypeptidase